MVTATQRTNDRMSKKNSTTGKAAGKAAGGEAKKPVTAIDSMLPDNTGLKTTLQQIE